MLQKKSPGGVEEEGLKRKREEMLGTDCGIQRYLVTVEYIGTRFLGFQKQKNMRTVQGVLEAAFENFVGHPVASAVSSRTDTGVHALANTCHVDIERRSKRKPGEVPVFACKTKGQSAVFKCNNYKMPPHEAGVVKRAVNHFLQRDAGDMAVVGVQIVPLEFHARFRAQERTYHYRVLAGKGQLSVFQKDHAWYVPENLNLPAMEEACKVLEGYHDFSSFRAAGCQAKSPMKTLDELHVCETHTWPWFPTQEERRASSLGAENKEMGNPTNTSMKSDLKSKLATREQLRCFIFTARARSFLYHQVRLLVGLLKAVGCQTHTVQDVQRILDSRTITATPAMAPACGLYLAEVKYDFDEDKSKDLDLDDEDE